MIEILRLSDLTRITHYPQVVVDTIRKSVAILDDAYGKDRSRDGDGGLELIVEKEEELANLIQSLPYGDLPEFAEVIHQDFLHAVYIVSNERSLDVFTPLEWATQAMKEAMSQ